MRSKVDKVGKGGNDAPANSNTSELEVLRNLLLADERAHADVRTHELNQRIEQAVTDEAFLGKLTETLAVALRNAEQQNPRAIAKAISPAVVKSIRREIVNSRDEMVEALYPITGRLVRAAVGDAMKSFAEDVNRRLDAITSPRFLAAKVKSVIFRKPAAEFLIADANSELAIRRILLIDRQSGNPLHSWYADEAAADQEDASALVSGMFAALSAFAAEKYDAHDAELRTLDLNGNTVALRHSAKLILVVEHEGKLNPAAAAKLDALFANLVELAEDPSKLADIEPFAAFAPEEKSSGKLKFVALVALPVLVALTAWTSWDRYWFAGKVELVTAGLERQLGVHNLAVLPDRQARSISLGGTVTGTFDAAQLGQLLEGSGVTLINQTRYLPDQNDWQRDIAQLRAQLDGDRAVLLAGQDALTARLQQAQATQREASADLQRADEAQRQTNADLQAALAALQDRADSIENMSLAEISADVAVLIGGQGDLAETALENREKLADLRSNLSAQADAANRQLTATRVESAEAREAMQTSIARAIAALRTEGSADLKRLSEREAMVDQGVSQDVAFLQSQLDNLRAASEARTISLENQVQAQAEATSSTAARLEMLRANAIQTIESQIVEFGRGAVPSNETVAGQALAQVSAVAQMFGMAVKVVGYSDDAGQPEPNLLVSSQRAQWGRDQLVQLGLPSASVSIEAKGSSPDTDGLVKRQIRFQVVNDGGS